MEYTKQLPVNKTWPWLLVAILAVLTGLYPFTYYFIRAGQFGLLRSKPAALIGNAFYIVPFYFHVTFGGLALLTGWSQFNTRIRERRIRLHRNLGKIYILSVLFSSLAGLIIAFHAHGGLISSLGFGLLSLCWLYSDIRAYVAIRKLDIDTHRAWMIRNYAMTFAAVTLRIYLPLSSMVLHLDFTTAYRAIAWLCWVPNLLIAERIIARRPPGMLQNR